MKSNLTHIFLAIALVILLLLLTDPFMYWMPPLVATLALLLIAAIMCVWTFFVMKESGGDERELLHRMHAGRIAYLSGSAVLTIALVVQGLQHEIDPWIALTLVVMVLAKLVSRIYFERYK